MTAGVMLLHNLARAVHLRQPAPAGGDRLRTRRAASKTGGNMKRVLLITAAVLALAGSAQARTFGRNDGAEGSLVFVQQPSLGDEDDDDEATERPMPRWDDDEVIRPMPPGPPGPPSDDDEDE